MCGERQRQRQGWYLDNIAQNRFECMVHLGLPGFWAWITVIVDAEGAPRSIRNPVSTEQGGEWLSKTTNVLNSGLLYLHIQMCTCAFIHKHANIPHTHKCRLDGILHFPKALLKASIFLRVKLRVLTVPYKVLLSYLTSLPPGLPSMTWLWQLWLSCLCLNTWIPFWSQSGLLLFFLECSSSHCPQSS